MRLPPAPPRLVAFAAAVGVNAACAALFWLTVGSFGSEAFLSFWNRPAAGRILLTVGFLFVGGRFLIWYTRKLDAYATARRRGPLRLTPLAFGLGVFAMTTSWLVVTLAGESVHRALRLILMPEALDVTVLLMPLVFFIQFLFSSGTLVWILCGGIVWQLAARLPACRARLLAYYGPAGDAGSPSPKLSFTRTWNVLGYLILLLSLLYQS